LKDLQEPRRTPTLARTGGGCGENAGRARPSRARSQTLPRPIADPPAPDRRPSRARSRGGGGVGAGGPGRIPLRARWPGQAYRFAPDPPPAAVRPYPLAPVPGPRRPPAACGWRWGAGDRAREGMRRRARSAPGAPTRPDRAREGMADRAREGTRGYPLAPDRARPEPASGARSRSRSGARGERERLPRTAGSEAAESKLSTIARPGTSGGARDER